MKDTQQALLWFRKIRGCGLLPMRNIRWGVCWIMNLVDYEGVKIATKIAA
jgi:hypothetical protein